MVFEGSDIKYGLKQKLQARFRVKARLKTGNNCKTY